MRKLLFVSVILAATILLLVGQGQLLGKTEAQDQCEYYSLDDRKKGGTLKDCGEGMSYILPSGDECELNQDPIEVFDCVNEVECNLVNVHTPKDVSFSYSAVVVLSCN